MDSRSAAEQAWQPDAAESTGIRRQRRAPRVSEHASMTPRELPHAAEDLQMLEQTWADPRGVLGWLMHVDHKSIGRRYLVTAFGLFLIGGVLAALIRLQLARL